jgi:uncharacterized protein
VTPLVAAGVVLSGVGTGVLSALFGVGGGIVMVPFMTIALDMSQHAAEGTSLLVIVPTAIAGVLAHRRLQRISTRLVVLLGVGGMAGSFAGASLALEIDGDNLEKLFGALVIGVGVRLLWSGIASMRRQRSEWRF